MKQVLYGALLGIILVFSTIGIITIESRTGRENDVQRTLKRATDAAIESVMENQSYTVNSNEQLVATLTEMICDSIISHDGAGKSATEPDKNLKLVIEVVEADYVKGLICLNIIEEYTNPSGAIGTCEYATTVVFDEVQLYETFTINYYNANGILIASYIAKEGDEWPRPTDAIMAKYKITQWGSTQGGNGQPFHMPEKVPGVNDADALSTYPHFNAATGELNLYGNYAG